MNDQRSLTEQMRDLIPTAVEQKMYDAADFIGRQFPSGPSCTCRVANKAEDVTTTLGKCPVHGDGALA